MANEIDIQTSEPIESVYRIRLNYLPWQADVRNKIIDHDKKIIVLACGARCGKDAFSVNFAMEQSLRLAIQRKNSDKWFRKSPRVNVSVIAPRRELYGQTFEELKSIAGPLIKHDRQYKHWERLPGDIVWKFKTIHDGDQYIVGDSPDIVIFTEACRTPLSSSAYAESLIPRLNSPGSYGLIMINGTPRVGKNHWYRKVFDTCMVDPFSYAVQHPSWANPEMANRRIIEQLKATLSPMQFRCEIAAQWPEDDVGLFSRRNFEAMTCRVPENVYADAKHVIGIDPAAGQDSTAVAIFAITKTGVFLRYIHWIKERDLMSQIKEIAEIVDMCRLPYITIDATGHGGIFFYEAAKGCFHRVQDINDIKLTQERKNSILGDFIVAFDKMNFAIDINSITEDKLEKLWSELEGFDFRVNDNGSISYSGVHDDAVMACAIAWQKAQIIALSMSRKRSNLLENNSSHNCISLL